MLRPLLHVGRFPGNAKCAVTTSWDDNSELDMEVMEILDDSKLKGTFYIDPGNLVENGLSNAQLNTLAHNHEVESHTWSHKNLAICDSATVTYELVEAKRYLEGLTGKPILGLAYPYGRYTSDLRKKVQEYGYLYARAVHEGNLSFPPSDPYAWGITVAVGSFARLLSRKSPLYIKNLTNRWPRLALKLFDQARNAGGVWHLMGHAYDFAVAKIEDAIKEVFGYVGNRDDVWYTTNGMLFVNEIARRSVSITQTDYDNRTVFRVQSEAPLAISTAAYSIPFCLVVPDEWHHGASVEIVGDFPTRFETRDPFQYFDIRGKDTELVVTQV